MDFSFYDIHTTRLIGCPLCWSIRATCVLAINGCIESTCPQATQAEPVLKALYSLILDSAFIFIIILYVDTKVCGLVSSPASASSGEWNGMDWTRNDMIGNGHSNRDIKYSQRPSVEENLLQVFINYHNKTHGKPFNGSPTPIWFSNSRAIKTLCPLHWSISHHHHYLGNKAALQMTSSITHYIMQSNFFKSSSKGDLLFLISRTPDLHSCQPFH